MFWVPSVPRVASRLRIGVSCGVLSFCGRRSSARIVCAAFEPRRKSEICIFEVRGGRFSSGWHALAAPTSLPVGHAARHSRQKCQSDSSRLLTFCSGLLLICSRFWVVSGQKKVAPSNVFYRRNGRFCGHNLVTAGCFPLALF